MTHQHTANGNLERPLDYQDFRFPATIDYIEILISTSVASNLDTVRKRLGIPYAKPLDAGPG